MLQLSAASPRELEPFSSVATTARHFGQLPRAIVIDID